MEHLLQLFPLLLQRIARRNIKGGAAAFFLRGDLPPQLPQRGLDLLPGALPQQHHKLVAADAVAVSQGPKGLLDQLGSVDDGLISGLVALIVVDLLLVVQVQHHTGQGPLLPLGLEGLGVGSAVL